MIIVGGGHIGLDLGGPISEEIAVSILAQVIAIRRGASLLVVFDKAHSQLMTSLTEQLCKRSI